MNTLLTKANNDYINEILHNVKSTNTLQISNEFVKSALSSSWLLNNITNDLIFKFLKDDKINRICNHRYSLYVRDNSIIDVLEYVAKYRKNKDLSSLLKDEENTNKLLAFFFNIYKNISNLDIGSLGSLDGGSKKIKRKMHVGINSDKKIHIGIKGGKYYLKKGKKIYVK